MKRIGAVLLSLVFLSGCSQEPRELKEGLALRSALLQGDGCAFSVDITADYGMEVHTFSLDCQADREGEVSFTVTAPETISGITGELSEEEGRLTFEGDALCFPLLADGLLSPAAAPWVLVNTLREGFLDSACREENKTRLTLEDSYHDSAIMVDVWLEENPTRAEILWEGRRILTMEVRNFRILEHSGDNSIE